MNKFLAFRYPEDVYDRIWEPDPFLKWAEINTSQSIDSQAQDDYWPPSVVMRTAGTPANANEAMTFYIDMEDNTLKFLEDNNLKFLVYMHFSEIVRLQANQRREFNISFNGKHWFGPVVPDYLSTTTIYSPSALTAGKYEFSIYKTERSTLPPLLNAIEIYYVLPISQSQTNQEDGMFFPTFALSGQSIILSSVSILTATACILVTFEFSVDAVMNIKSSYGIKKNWQGDPCTPQGYLWDGLNCSNSDNDMLRIISL